MEIIFACLTGCFFAASIYLFMSKYLIRVLLGVVLLGNAVNLSIFTAGRLTREVPPFIPADSVEPVAGIANPLPQALILTAIVISFAFFAFLLVLTYRAYQELGTENTDQMRLAEPEAETAPPTGY